MAFLPLHDDALKQPVKKCYEMLLEKVAGLFVIDEALG